MCIGAINEQHTTYIHDFIIVTVPVAFATNYYLEKKVAISPSQLVGGIFHSDISSLLIKVFKKSATDSFCERPIDLEMH